MNIICLFNKFSLMFIFLLFFLPSSLVFYRKKSNFFLLLFQFQEGIIGKYTCKHLIQTWDLFYAKWCNPAMRPWALEGRNFQKNYLFISMPPILTWQLLLYQKKKQKHIWLYYQKVLQKLYRVILSQKKKQQKYSKLHPN